MTGETTSRATDGIDTSSEASSKLVVDIAVCDRKVPTNMFTFDLCKCRMATVLQSIFVGWTTCIPIGESCSLHTLHVGLLLG